MRVFLNHNPSVFVASRRRTLPSAGCEPSTIPTNAIALACAPGSALLPCSCGVPPPLRQSPLKFYSLLRQPPRTPQAPWSQISDLLVRRHCV